MLNTTVIPGVVTKPSVLPLVWAFCFLLAVALAGCADDAPPGATALPAPESATTVTAAAEEFELVEATIKELHAAIQSGNTTCVDVVQGYLDRAKAYNGVCTALVTEDGAPIELSTGYVRGGEPIQFPTETVAAATIYPDLDKYEGLPMEFGRMAPTASNPNVQQQFGMRVGIPNAGQLNALETLNVRGERSQSCPAECDAALSTGPLPAHCSASCETLRQQPDALERAAELDAQYGRNPDLAAMPMYCVAFSFKNWYDAKDIRSTGGNDVNYAMDVPTKDSPDIADLRAKGAIIYASATAADTGLELDGAEKAQTYTPNGGQAYAQWAGQTCNPYDTTRVPRGTSNGSGVSVSANLAHCSICEQGSASCKGPASRNGVVNFLTTKGLMMHGGMNSQSIGDRAGIHCRTVEDAALVLDAVKGFNSEDMYTALPLKLIPDEPYASFVVQKEDLAQKPLSGMRIGVVRELMIKPTLNDVAISDQIDNEIKTYLRDMLGAELVESVDPLYPDDPQIANMSYTFQDAFAEIIAHNMPEYFWQKDRNGELEFAVPGWDVTTVDYAIALAMGKAPLSEELTLRRINQGLVRFKSPFTVNKYLAERGDARVFNWETFVANSAFMNDSQRAGSVNAIGVQDIRASTIAPNDMDYLKMRIVLQLVVAKVMAENDIDAFVNPEVTLPQYILGGAVEPEVENRGTGSCCSAFTALLGGPEIDVPAGFNQIVYEPQLQLSEDRTEYEAVTGTEQSLMEKPMPISLMVWGGPGSEPELIKVASAYEAASQHRTPPPDFGPLEAK
jgi:Asp-tRNA(Asn)/Glu-tRNA(Gln) amidotransferase A subunit family amidase